MLNNIKLLFAASTVVFLSLAACSGAPDESTTSDEAEAVTHLGKMCGGIAGITCHSTKLVCKITSHHPDASGTCVKAPPKPGTLGGLCGGFAGIACNAGLDCEFESSGPPPGAMGLPLAPGDGPPPGAMGLPLPDQSGTCQPSPPPRPGHLGMPINP
jgi:hypothetical protein